MNNPIPLHKLLSILFGLILPFNVCADGGYDPAAGGYDPSKEPPSAKKPIDPKAVAFKDYVIGQTTPDDLVIARKFKCNGSICTLDPAMSESIANVPISFMMLVFDNGRLVSISLESSREGFDNVLKAMVQKYGKPKTSKVVALQNAYGAKYTSREVAWLKNGVLIQAQEMKNLDSSLIMFTAEVEIKKIMNKKSSPDI